MLLPLLLAVPLFQQPLPAPGPELRVEAGRAAGVVAGEVRDFARGERASLASEGYLELAPAARVELVWRGRASVRVHGPASFEWSAGPGGEPRLLAWFADGIELDVRRGELALSYARRVALDVRRGALSLRELSGGLRVQHHGGEESRLWLFREDTDEPWARRRLPSGARVRIRWIPSRAAGVRTSASPRCRPSGPRLRCV